MSVSLLDPFERLKLHSFEDAGFEDINFSIAAAILCLTKSVKESLQFFLRRDTLFAEEVSLNEQRSNRHL